MSRKFSPSDFAKSLSEGTLANNMEITGMVKPIDDDLSAVLFSEGVSCEVWTRIPLEMIEAIEFETMIRCRDHEHPLVRLELKQPRVDNVEAGVLASLLRWKPTSIANTVHEVGDAEGRVPSIPSLIARELASGYGIDSVTGFVQCVTVLNSILNEYQRCVDRGGNESGCARIAARNIATLACRSYCTCE